MTTAFLALTVVAMLAWVLFTLFRAARSAGRTERWTRPDVPTRSAAGLEELVLTVQEAMLALDERAERLTRLVADANMAAARLERVQQVAAIRPEPAGISEAKPVPLRASREPEPPEVASVRPPLRSRIPETDPAAARAAGTRQRQSARTRVARVAHLAAVAPQEMAPALEPPELREPSRASEPLEFSDTREDRRKAETRILSQPAGGMHPTHSQGASEIPRGPAPINAPAASPAQRVQEVYSLADAGLTAEAIASRLALARGEVQLMLGLRRLG